MTVDPHQIRNLALGSGLDAVSAMDNSDTGNDILPLLHELNKVVSKLGDCKGSECYELGDDRNTKDSWKDTHDNPEISMARKLSLEYLQSSIRSRIPCHNPPNITATNTNQRRRPFAYDLPVPKPFVHGFPFSDGDNVPDDLLQTWNDYEHYFY